MQYGEKQIQIMEVAEALFADMGFSGTSVRDIAEKAAVNVAMISYYFGSKEKLLEAIFEYRGDKTKLILENLVSKSDVSAMDKMNLLIDHYLQKIASQQCFHRLMVREQSGQNSEAVTAMIYKLKRQNLEVVKRLIREGQETGEFRKDIDTPLLMITMLGTANQLLTSQHHYKQLNDLQDMPEDEYQQYLHTKLAQHLKFLFKKILTNEA
jgi:AcrR family transcriptional regulator